MTQEALTLTGLGTPAVELTVEATEARDGLLLEASRIKTVADQIDADSAAMLLRDMQTFLRMIESGRKSVKQPVLDVGRAIDATAKKLVQRLEVESDRISRLLGSYQAEQRRMADARVQEERRRLEAEAKERAAAIASAETEEDREKAKEEAQTALAELQAALDEVTPPKIYGTAVRATWYFEVIDIEALFRAAPHLCIIEPNNAAIRAAIKNGKQFPGLRVWKEEKATIINR